MATLATPFFHFVFFAWSEKTLLFARVLFRLKNSRYNALKQEDCKTKDEMIWEERKERKKEDRKRSDRFIHCINIFLAKKVTACLRISMIVVVLCKMLNIS